MFYRYISENLTEYINESDRAAGNPGFDYARMSDAASEEAREVSSKKKALSTR